MRPDMSVRVLYSDDSGPSVGVPESSLREWVRIYREHPACDVTVWSTALGAVAEELLELREKVKRLEDEKAAALKLAVGLPADVLDDRHLTEVVPPPGPDREPEGPTEEEPGIQVAISDVPEGAETVTGYDPDWIPSVQAGPPPRDDEAAARAERMTEWATIAFRARLERDASELTFPPLDPVKDSWLYAVDMELERARVLREQGGGSDDE